MHQDLIRAKTGLPLDFEWLEARNKVLNSQFGAVRLTIACIELLVQAKFVRSTNGTTQREQQLGLAKSQVFYHSPTLRIHPAHFDLV